MMDIKHFGTNVLRAVTLLAVAAACTKGLKLAPEPDDDGELPVSPALTAVPFQSSDSQEWGLLGMDGTVLLADTLKSEPTNAVNGIYLVKNSHGYYEYYTAEAAPRKIGTEYTVAGLFYEDIAPCVEKGSRHIQFLRKDGTVAADFKEVGGKPVEWVGRFCNGLAPFKAGAYVGYVDKTGQVVLKPQYLEAGDFNDGYALVVDTVGTNEHDYKARQPYRIAVIDVAGQVQPLSLSSTDSIGRRFSQGLLHTVVHQNDTLAPLCQFVDAQGRMLIPAKPDYLQVSDMCGTHFAFYNGRSWGIADNQTTAILEPLFDEVLFIGPSSVAVCQYGKYRLLNYLGEQLTPGFPQLRNCQDGQHLIATRSEGGDVLLTVDGEQQGEPQAVIAFRDGPERVSVK